MIIEYGSFKFFIFLFLNRGIACLHDEVSLLQEQLLRWAMWPMSLLLNDIRSDYIENTGELKHEATYNRKQSK